MICVRHHLGGYVSVPFCSICTLKSVRPLKYWGRCFGRISVVLFGPSLLLLPCCCFIDNSLIRAPAVSCIALSLLVRVLYRLNLKKSVTGVILTAFPFCSLVLFRGCLFTSFFCFGSVLFTYS